MTPPADIEPTFRALVRQAAGGLLADVYPHAALPACPPGYATYHRVATRRDRTQAGPTGLAAATLQLDIWHASRASARAAADAVAAALDGFSGPGPAGGSRTRRVWSAALADDFETADPTGLPDEARYYRVTQLWRVWYAEALDPL